MISFRRAARIVVVINLAWFALEFSVALTIGSVSLFADSVDFLEDVSLNLLILLALRWSARARARIGMLLAAVLLAPAIATLWTAVEKVLVRIPPQPVPLSLTAAGALAVNLACALLLARYKDHHGSLTKAAFLSARNDVVASAAIVAAGGVTALTASFWPDLLLGLSIGVLNAGAAAEVWKIARREHLAAAP
jgi:Co/Zn/Cd efflux system component